MNPACDHTFAPTDVLGTNHATLAGPGVFCFPSSAQLTGKLTLIGSGPWIFIIGSTLTTATNSSVVMSGSGNDTDVFWAVGSSATLGTGTAFTGNILAVASITLTTGSSVSGRAIALNGAVTMDTNNVASTCSSGPCQHPLPVPPRPIDVTQLVIDHYLCYQATPEEKVQQHQVVLEDQFGKRTVTLKHPETICTPVIEDTNPNTLGTFPGDLRYPSDHLACYQIDESGENGNNGNDRREVLMQNEFGKTTYTVKKPRFLCVPSLKTLLSGQHDR
jgi:hypothetical protein